jgi:thiamine biosynthesis protein ThiS
MVVNGKEVALQTGTSLKEYLEGSGYDLTKIAVEKNGRIVARDLFASETLSGGDCLEIVGFVGGG